MRLVDGGKQPAIEAPITKYSIKALVMPVLPWALRLTEAGRPMMRLQPCCDLLCHKLRTILTLHIPRSTTLDNQPPPRAKPWIPFRQSMDTGHSLVLYPCAWLPAFRTTMLCQHATGPSLTHSVRVFHIHGSAPFGSQAYQFFPQHVLQHPIA
jgi:hypothetical protein